MTHLYDKSLWTKKARAFVIRSHRHLWGKNNETPLAFLFTRGLENRFMKTKVIGWNKFGQKRSMENWGLAPGFNKESKLFLPPGIVVPFIVKKELKSLFIHSCDDKKKNNTLVVPGSAYPTLILADEKSGQESEYRKIVFIQNLLDGLYLFQETKGTFCVLIHPNPSVPVENHVKSMLKNSSAVFILSANQTQENENRQLLSDFGKNCFHICPLKEEMVKLLKS